MRTHGGLGPVFVYESMLNARRPHVYVGRAIFVLLLLAGMTLVWISHGQTQTVVSFRVMAAVGQGFFYALAGIQLSLVMLAAPASAAGSLCTDRARGTLHHMLVTDLSVTEIVIGKLASRLAPVYGLIACALPVTALAGLLGGIDFGALAGCFIVSLALAALGCALAVFISVWATRTHDVLMAVYVLEGLYLLALPIWWALSRAGGVARPPDWIHKANPFVIVFAPYNQPGFVNSSDYAIFVAVIVGISSVLAIASIARIRSVVLSEGSRAKSSRRRFLTRPGRVSWLWAGPTLDGNPVLWREWRYNRPSRLARWLGTLLFCASWGLFGWGAYSLATNGASLGSDALTFGVCFQVLFGFLMLSASAPTVLAEERMRGSLDVLLSTPLSTTSIVLAKWWGVFRRVLVLAILPLLAVVLHAAVAPDVVPIAGGGRFAIAPIPLNRWDRIFAPSLCVFDFLASGALIVSLGLALATWVRRLGRAVALSVVLYFLAGIGFIALTELAYELVRPAAPTDWLIRNRWFMTVLTSFSPVAGPINAMEPLTNYAWEPRHYLWRGFAVVALIKTMFAGLLLVLTIKTFDHRLGRTRETRLRQSRQKPVRIDELVAAAT
jgi:ABC-type transport system involved in multi-copper enzyme maturation permease subunit